MNELLKIEELKKNHYQLRELGENQETINEYSSLIKEYGTEFFPVPLVAVYEDSYRVLDGWHRIYAAEMAGEKDIECELREIKTKEELSWIWTEQNNKNGLPRTNADKRRAVEICLKDHSEKSDSVIAMHCAVSKSLVLHVRDELEKKEEIKKVDFRVGKDGKKQKVKKTKKDKPANDHNISQQFASVYNNGLGLCAAETAPKSDIEAFLSTLPERLPGSFLIEKDDSLSYPRVINIVLYKDLYCYVITDYNQRYETVSGRQFYTEVEAEPDYQASKEKLSRLAESDPKNYKFVDDEEENQEEENQEEENQEEENPNARSIRNIKINLRNYVWNIAYEVCKKKKISIDDYINDLLDECLD